METALTGLIIIMVLLITVSMLAHAFLSAQDALLESWRGMEERMGERSRTSLSSVVAEAKNLGGTVEITLRNDGDTKLADFDRWDVILQYTAGDGQRRTGWYPYGLGQNEWTKVGIFLDASAGTAEVFDAGILNPGEEIVLQVSVNPWVRSPSTNLVTAVAPNGIAVSTVFTY
jgi:hypothetical protein